VDKFQLRQALINLIANALDAMPSGGTLTLTTIRDGDYLEIGIADTGVGIAQEHWNKLFAPFFTTKASGTGLGLAIVSHVIENHKGSLRFESAAGQGTSFYIRLAIRPGSVLRESAAPAVVKSDELLP
jgi:signal transduction histidine kinase